MDFDTAFVVISKLNEMYAEMLNDLKSAPHPAFTDDESMHFMRTFDDEYARFWNNDFRYCSQEEREFLNRMLDGAGKMKEQIYSEMESVRY